MTTRIVISFWLVVTLATAAVAETKPSQQSEIEAILNAVTQMQSDVKALQTAVAGLATSQSAQAAQLQDMSRRLYATCVLSQRLMDVTVPGGWSENALCTYKGLTAPGEAVTRDIFGQNPVHIDTKFGGP
jgi:hypothetical protein